LLDTRYAFMSAYLKGEEARLVTPDHINKMSKTSNIQDALAIIKDTDIGDYLEGVAIKTFDDLDKYLWEYFGECPERLEWFKPVPADILKILKAYIAKYDVLNIKAALQAISTGKKTKLIPVGLIHNYGLLDELSSAEDVDSIIELLTKCKLESYASILEGYKIDGGAESRLLTEARLDGEYYKNLLNIAKGIKDGSVLAQAFSIIIDLTNLQMASRAIIEGMDAEVAGYTIAGGYMTSEKVIKELLSLKLTELPGKWRNTLYYDVAEAVSSSYTRTKNISIVEEIIEKHKFRLSKEILSPRLLSPLVLVWYLILKELEIRNLRLILKAMFDNIPLEEIKQYLVLPS